jgi:hypothetical protein
MILIGATTTSSEQDPRPHKPIKPQQQLYHQPRRPRHHQLCLYLQSLPAISHSSNHHQSHSKRPTEWFKRLGSRGSEGGVSKPQIPYRVDWCVSFKEVSTCGSATQSKSQRTASIDAPINQRLQQVESCNK